MKPTRATCPRLFEVEAARDGRVTGAELTRFQTHLARCAVCAQESQALDALAHSLHCLPAVTADALHTRRERTRLIAAFDAALVPASPLTPASNIKRWLLPLVAAALVTTLTLTLWHLRMPGAPSAPVATRARDPITIHATDATRWSRQVESHRENITLTAGTLSISIDHNLGARRVRVVLPDGELEDLGTTFTVTASASATTHVAVQDGTVILRLRDRAPIVLGKSESWTPAAPAPALPLAPAPPPTSTPPAPAAAPARAPAAPLTPAPAAASATDDSANDFRAALTALNAGNNALAATLFTAFVARHPSAPNAEDAAYLRVIALQRAGNPAATTSAARDYLRRYPDGFRRAEIEPLAH